MYIVILLQRRGLWEKRERLVSHSPKRILTGQERERERLSYYLTFDQYTS